MLSISRSSSSLGGVKEDDEDMSRNNRDEADDISIDSNIGRIEDEDLTLAESENISKKKTIDVESYVNRLKKRTDLISELRAAYLRDIVMLKYQLEQLLTNDERFKLLADWKKSIPSIDLRQHLMLYSPNEASLDIIPCDRCGGSVEIVHHDSSEIEELSKALSHLDKNKDELRIIIATRGSQLEAIQKKMEMMEMGHQNEKRVLFNQMKALRTEDDALKGQLDNCNFIIKNLRAENTEFKTMNSEHFIVRDRMQKAEVENDRLRSELRALEDAQQASKDEARLLRAKLTNKTKDADELTRKVADLQVEVSDAQETVQRNRANAEAYHRRNEKLQGLLESARKEVEDLQAAKSNIMFDLEQCQAQSSTEIENLESMLDKLREEKEVLGFELKEVRDTLTATTLSLEQAEASYNDVYLSHTNYKDKALKDIAALNQQIAELKEKLKNSADEIYDLKSKVPDNPVDPNVLDKVQKQLKALQDENIKHRHDNGSMRETVGGRRQGVVVKDGKDAIKKRTKPKRTIMSSSGFSAVESEKEEEDTEEDKQKVADRVDGEVDVTEESSTANKAVKRAPRQILQRKVVKKKVSEDDLFDEETEDEEQEENIATVKAGKAAVKYKPLQRQRGKSTSSKPVSEVGKTSSSESSSKTVSSGRKRSHKKTEQEVSESSSLPPQGDASAAGGDIAQDLVAEANAFPSATDSSLKAATSDMGGADPEMAATVQEGPQGDPEEELFSPTVVIPRTMSNKRITRLASREPENPRTLMKKSSTILLEDGELLEEVGCNNDYMIDTFFKSFSDDDEGSEAASISDESDSEDEFDVEVSVDVAKTWGNFTKALNDVLTDNMTEDAANHITHVIAPITIEFSSLLVKSTIGMWKAMKIAKRNADMLYKLNAMSTFIAPMLGMEVQAKAVEKAQQQLIDPSKFEENKENWMRKMNISNDLMTALCLQEFDKQSGKLVDSKACTYFGYHTADRNYKYEVALSTILQMKGFNDVILDDLDESVKRVFVDWSASKLQALRGGRGRSAGIVSVESTFSDEYDFDMGFGGGGEAKIAAMYDQVNELERKGELQDRQIKQLESDLEGAKAMIAELTPVAKRANELSERNGIVSKSLTETNVALSELDEAYNELQKKHAKLEADHNITSEKMTKMTTLSETRKQRIEVLETTLNEETDMHQEAAKNLAYQLERERARINDLNNVAMQTEPFVSEMGCQTEFNVPLLSLRHKGASDIPRGASASTKKVYFPVVTPGAAHVSQPSLGDAFPENSIGFDDTFNLSVTAWSSFADSADTGSFRSVPVHTNRTDLRSAPPLRRNSKVHVGLPSVNSDQHSSPRGSRDILDAVPTSPLFPNRGQSQPFDGQRPREIMHSFSHSGVDWEATSTAERLRVASAKRNRSASMRPNVEDILESHRSDLSGISYRNHHHFNRDRARLQSR